MTDASKRGRNNRLRGMAGEREACDLLHSEFGVAAKRNLNQSRDGGDDILHCGPVAVEVKRQKKLAIRRWMEQAEASCDTRLPIVMCREDGDRKDWLVILRWQDARRLLREEFA